MYGLMYNVAFTQLFVFQINFYIIMQKFHNWKTVLFLNNHLYWNLSFIAFNLSKYNNYSFEKSIVEITYTPWQLEIVKEFSILNIRISK